MHVNITDPVSLILLHFCISKHGEQSVMHVCDAYV